MAAGDSNVATTPSREKRRYAASLARSQLRDELRPVVVKRHIQRGAAVSDHHQHVRSSIGVHVLKGKLHGRVVDVVGYRLNLVHLGLRDVSPW